MSCQSVIPNQGHSKIFPVLNIKRTRHQLCRRGGYISMKLCFESFPQRFQIWFSNFPCKWRRGFAAELQLVLSSSSGNSSLAQRHSVRGLVVNFEVTHFFLKHFLVNRFHKDFCSIRSLDSRTMNICYDVIYIWSVIGPRDQSTGVGCLCLGHFDFQICLQLFSIILNQVQLITINYN